MAGRRGGKGGKQGGGKKKGKRGASASVPAADGEVTRDHNVSVRREALANALRAIYEIDCEIASFIEQHITGLREDKSAIRKSLRERFGLTAKVFNARYSAYRIERDAEESKDEITQDAIRELFEVCPVTGQGSFAEALVATKPKAPAAPPKPTKPVAQTPPPPAEAEDAAVDPEQAWAEGEAARKAGLGLDACRYTTQAQRKLKARWEEGWEACDYELKRASGEIVRGRPSLQ